MSHCIVLTILEVLFFYIGIAGTLLLIHLEEKAKNEKKTAGKKNIEIVLKIAVLLSTLGFAGLAVYHYDILLPIIMSSNH